MKGQESQGQAGHPKHSRNRHTHTKKLHSSQVRYLFNEMLNRIYIYTPVYMYYVCISNIRRQYTLHR